jgi:hypothetical protein
MHGPLNVKCSSELPVSLTYRVMQTTQVLHFKFLRLCLLKDSLTRETKKNDNRLPPVVGTRRTTVMSEKLPLQHGVSPCLR